MRNISPLIRSAGILLSGTALAQFVAIATLPLITRIYSPNEFGEFASYSSVIGIISVIACGRFELAIPNAATDRDAGIVFATAVTTLCITTTLLSIFALTLYSQSSAGILGPNYYYLPLGVFISGLFNIFQFALIRSKRFKTIAVGRLRQTAATTFAQLAFGILQSNLSGLIVAQLVGGLTGLAHQLQAIGKLTVQKLRKLRLASLKRSAKKNIAYPLYSAPEALLNTLGIYGPILLIAAWASPEEAGYVSLAMKVMQVPVSLIAGSASQVFLAHSKEKHSTNNLADFSAATLTAILKVGIGPLALLGFIAPNLFVLGFGDQWQRSGSLLLWMTPWFCLQLLASPISTVTQTQSKQSAMLLLTSAGCATRLGAVVVANMFFKGTEAIAYAISGAVFYACCLLFFLNVAGVSRTCCLNIFHSSKFHLIGWFSMIVLALAAIG